MRPSRWLCMGMAAVAIMPPLTGCDAFTCWYALLESRPINGGFLKPIAGAPVMDLAGNPVTVAVAPDGNYVAVASWADTTDPSTDPNGFVSAFWTGLTDSNNVQRIAVGTNPYGLTWLSRNDLLVCNEGRAATAGTVPLQYLSIPRGSDDPTDPNYYGRDLSKATIRDVSADTTGTTTRIYGPSEAAIIPTGGTSGAAVAVTARFFGAVYLVFDVTGGSRQVRLILTDPNDPNDRSIDEPRGIDVSKDAKYLWICNYGTGANDPTALTLAKTLIAAKLNQLRGVPAADPNAVNDAILLADSWLALYRDPDGKLPYRWAEPEQGPGQTAWADANDLIEVLNGYNTSTTCTDPVDTNCPLTPQQWVEKGYTNWPASSNTDPNWDTTLVLGDAADPNQRYTYQYAQQSILNRPVETTGTVTVYNIGMAKIEAIITVPPRPRSVRISPDNTKAVVTCSGQDGQTGAVVVIDVATRLVTATRRMSFVPGVVRLNALASRAYVSGWSGDKMAAINIKTMCPSNSGTSDTHIITTIDRPAALDTTADVDVLWGATYSGAYATEFSAFEGGIPIP